MANNRAHADPILALNANQSEVVHLELGRILESPSFRTSKRSQKFLRFVVESTLAGNGDLLKESTLAMHVFDRTTDFDSSANATVRVAATEVRKRLTRFYLEHGAGDQVQIALPLGSYIPVFHFRESLPPELPAPPSSKWRWRPALAIALAASIALVTSAVIAAVLLYAKANSDTRLVQDLWRPVLEAPGPAIICLYLAPAFLPGQNRGGFVPANGRFVELGDAIAAGHIAGELSYFHKDDQTRVMGDISFADLRRSPAILLGESSTLAIAYTGQYRYAVEEAGGERVIQEKIAPYRTWKVHTSSAGSPSEDYGLATRVFVTDPGRVIMSLTGIDHFAIKAASEFVGSERYLKGAVAQLPAGWQTKDLQFVIHVNIIGKTTGPPVVVAAQAW